MKAFRMCFVLLALVLLQALLEAQVTAIVGGTLINGTGAQPQPSAVVLINGKKITAVGTREAIRIPAGAKIIDATGKYIIPGLIDANVHLVLNPFPVWLGKFEGRFEEVAAESAQIELKNGVTTVFDTYGPLQPLLNVRDRIRHGDLLTPA